MQQLLPSLSVGGDRHIYICRSNLLLIFSFLEDLQSAKSIINEQVCEVQASRLRCYASNLKKAFATYCMQYY